MNDFMRFPTAVLRDPAIDAWLESRRADLQNVATPWFECMRQCGSDVRELMHDGMPTACVDDGAFAYVNAFTNHVNVGFFQGAALPDPAKILQGTGKRMRHVKLRPDEAVNEAALLDLIHHAYTDMRSRLATR